MDRILLKMRNDGTGCWFHTVSRNRKGYKNLFISKQTAEQFTEKKAIPVFDGQHFARIQYIDNKVEIRFFWMFNTGNHTFKGYEESVQIPREIFERTLEQEGKYKCLSEKGKSYPQIEFRSKNNLSSAVANKTVRKKLSHFLANKFAWPRSDKIIIYDDFVPYSFYFEEYKGDTRGLCGGIILHGKEKLATAHYEMHT